MKRFLLASASLLALLAGSPAEAATVMFGYTGKVVSYVIPKTGTYQILAWGAEGGTSADSAFGGLGAEIGGDIVLQANFSLEIAVGQMGAPGAFGRAAGGGGGSFVLLEGGLLVAAGGGGGAGAPGPMQNHPNKGETGYAGVTSNGGGDGFGTLVHRGLGGSAGGGGSGGGYYQTGGGGAGAGVFGNGGDGVGGGSGQGGGGGHAYPNLAGGVGSAGSGAGGFGGGGGGGVSGTPFGPEYGGGGGGGGYSGGGGGQGRYDGAVYYGGGGGGGGSYDALTNQILKGGVQRGNGGVWITDISLGAPTPVPEPTTLALMSTGIAGLASLAALRRRRQKA